MRLNVCTQIEAGSTNEKKISAWDDVTKRLLFHKAGILTSLLASTGMLNMQLKQNNISSAYIVLALLCSYL